MKKLKYIILLTLLFTTRVNAEETYTYTFLYYSTEEITGENVTSEAVTLNRFYKIERYNEVYELIDYNSSYSPYIDYDDTKTYYNYSKTYIADYYYTVTLRAQNIFKTKQIIISNLDNIDVTINQIEVYSGTTEINFSISNTNNLVINLDDSYDIDTIKIYIYYDTVNYDADEATIEYIDEAGVYTLKDAFTFDTTNNPGTLIVNVLDTTTFAVFFPRYGIVNWKKLESMNVVEFYTKITTYYKFYNQQKVYYYSLEQDTLDGYSYDASESLSLYKVYSVSIEETNEPIVCVMPTTEVNQTIEEETDEEKEEETAGTCTPETITKYITRTSYIDTCDYNILETNEEELIIGSNEEESAEKTDEPKATAIKEGIISVLIYFILIFIIKIIHSIYVKCKKEKM